MGPPGRKDQVQPLSQDGDHTAPRHRPPRDRTDVVASLRGNRSPVQMPCPHAPRPGCFHIALRRAHQGLCSHPQPTGQPCGAAGQACRRSGPQNTCPPYSGPSPWCLLPGEGIHSSPSPSNFSMQEAGGNRRGSCGSERTPVLRKGRGRRDGVARPFWAVGSVARALCLRSTSC